MKKEKVSGRAMQAAETKKWLYESARKLFNECGVDNVSVDAIVDAAGVSKGTFYVHFESKDALLSTYILDYVERVDMDYLAFLSSLPDNLPASELLLSLTEKIFDVIEHTIGFENMRALYRVQLTESVHAQTVPSYNRSLYRMFGDVLGRGISQGEFKASLPVDELSRHLVMAMRGLTYEWCVRYPNFHLKEQALAHFNIFVTGILNDK